MDTKLAKIYYSPRGYWKGVSAIKKLAEASKVPENVVKQWLYKQAIWQIYLPAPQYVPRPKFDVATPNSVHQADLLFLPHDKLPRGRKIYKYALTVVDIASRYKEAEPLTSKDSNEVAKAFQSIYRCSPLTWPQMLQVDPGREFMGGVTKEMEKHKTYIQRGRTKIQRSGNCRAFQPHACWAPVWSSVCCGDASAWGQTVNWVGEKAAGCCQCPEQWNHSLDWQKTCCCNQRKKCCSKAFHPLLKTCWCERKKTSSSHQCEIFVSARWTWGRYQKSNRPDLVFESLPGC